MREVSVRICCVQIESVPGKPEQNLVRAKKYAMKARERGAHLVIFPEQYPTGWDPHGTDFTDDGSGAICAGWAAVAVAAGVHVLGSYRKKTESMPQNVAAVFAPDGTRIAEYAKIHLFSQGGEDVSFLPGNELALFTIGGVRFGIGICYDLRFADLFCAYARAGCDAVVVPAAWPCARLKHFDLFLHARALENQMFVAGVNTAGGRTSEVNCGGTTVVDPWGETVARAEDAGTALVCADIDLAAVREARSAFPVRADRRDDLYPSL
jgi:predicted amidohydrolase